MNKNLQGVVLKATDFKENAEIIYLYTPSGRVNLIVRGSKKINSKTRPFTQPLTLISYRKTSNKELNTLIEGEVADVFLSIKSNIKKMAIAYPLLEKLYLFGDKTLDDQQLFNFSVHILNLLKTSAYPEVLLVIFEVKLLYLLGLAPRFANCPICNKRTHKGYFSIEVGGLICDDCQMHGYNLNQAQSDSLKQLYLIKYENIDEQFLKSHQENIELLQTTIDNYYLKYLDFKSQSKKVMTRLKVEN